MIIFLISPYPAVFGYQMDLYSIKDLLSKSHLFNNLTEFSSRIQPDMSHHSESHIKEVSVEQCSKCETADLSGFSKVVSNGEAVEREQHVSDKFNGILYHVIPASISCDTSLQ